MAPELDVKIKELLLKNFPEDFMQMIYFEKSLLVPISLEEEKILLEKANKIGLKLSTYLRLSALEK